MVLAHAETLQKSLRNLVKRQVRADDIWVRGSEQGNLGGGSRISSADPAGLEGALAALLGSLAHYL